MHEFTLNVSKSFLNAFSTFLNPYWFSDTGLQIGRPICLVFRTSDLHIGYNICIKYNYALEAKTL